MSLFDFVAPLYDRFRFSETKTVSRIKELGHFSSRDRVLDIGGGTGIIAQYLSEWEISARLNCRRVRKLFFERAEIAGKRDHDGVVGRELGRGNEKLTVDS